MMGITDLNGRSWKGRNSSRFFQRPVEAAIYNFYKPTIAEKMRLCSGDCHRPIEVEDGCHRHRRTFVDG